MSDDLDDEILIQIHRATPNAVEVRAVSASDGLEVSFSAPAAAAQADLQRLARNKLAYVRSRQAKDQAPEGASRDEPETPSPQTSSPETPSDGRGGIIV